MNYSPKRKAENVLAILSLLIVVSSGAVAVAVEKEQEVVATEQVATRDLTALQALAAAKITAKAIQKWCEIRNQHWAQQNIQRHRRGDCKCQKT